MDVDTRIRGRIELCHLERRSYELWLRTLSPANFLLVGIGGVLSLLAGLSIITEAQLVSTTTAGWVAVAGAALTGLHGRLKCEPHQAECQKLANQFAELGTEYERLQVEPDEQARAAQLLALENKLAAIRAGRGARPGGGAVRRAARELEQQARPA